MSSKTPKVTTASDIVKYFCIEDAEVKLITDVVPTLNDAGMRAVAWRFRMGFGRAGRRSAILIMVIYMECLNMEQLLAVTLSRFHPEFIEEEEELEAAAEALDSQFYPVVLTVAPTFTQDTPYKDGRPNHDALADVVPELSNQVRAGMDRVIARSKDNIWALKDPTARLGIPRGYLCYWSLPQN
ncbi:unnamed protein product [Cyclocybe aegerita]|uniref:Uncharacterized protein n=1 Tax=Cyclocybe aegerita TaxID=1973307 RepID=A0A8S0WXC7_CYCAE|nr:unnamed protein product [Cyclocybe aegerita]